MAIGPVLPATSQGIQPAAVELRRPRAEVRAQRPREPALERVAFAGGDRLRALLVQLRCDPCGTAPVAEAEHLCGASHRADGDVDRVAGADLPRRLDTDAVDVHAPAQD